MPDIIAQGDFLIASEGDSLVYSPRSGPYAQRRFFMLKNRDIKDTPLSFGHKTPCGGPEQFTTKGALPFMSSVDQAYSEFLSTKKPRVESCGISPGSVNPILFDWQQAIVQWGLRKGRAAFFEDCGLGKTIQQCEWIRQIAPADTQSLIVAPLAVAQQTIAEAKDKLDLEIRYCTEPQDAPGIWITNYQRLHKFVGAQYQAIVLDESSILKSLDGKTRTLLLEQFTHIPYRLCCTATPSPNDIAELANHAEFLGVMSRKEMLATFFVHDSANGAGDGYRLKGHAEQDFWEWVAQWAIYIRRPSDIGFEDGGFVLPDLRIHEEITSSNFIPDGSLFPDITKGIQGRTQARRHTIVKRIDKAIEIISASDEQWLVWCGLNDEGRQMHKALKDSVLIEGSTDDEDRQAFEQKWRGGQTQTLITKPGMFGFGLNWQHCHNILYLGLSDSFEQWYQSVRRCWRFGQQYPVNVVVVTSDAEHVVVENVQRKEAQAAQMAEGIVAAIKSAQIQEVQGVDNKQSIYSTNEMRGDGWTVKLGDCVERIKEIESDSIGLSVFSPPFAKLYTYSASDRDMGNSKDYGQFFDHFKFLIPEIMRVTMPGRTCVVHCQDIGLTKVNDGVIGRKDFSRDISIEFEKQGWIYQGRITIQKNPQAQAIRTKARNLMFVQKNKDSAVSRPALADYLMLFEKPGQNTVPVKTDITNDEWITLAHPGWIAKIETAIASGIDIKEIDPTQFLSDLWTDINESDTLNARLARDSKDEAHLCPLQLGVIRRCVRLWSNPGEIVFSPFAGIGSEGYVSIEQRRRFIGIELKESYWKQAVANLNASVKQENLFTDSNTTAASA